MPPSTLGCLAEGLSGLGQNQRPGQDQDFQDFVGGAQDVAGDAAQALLKVAAPQPDQGGGGGQEYQAREPPRIRRARAPALRLAPARTRGLTPRVMAWPRPPSGRA